MACLLLSRILFGILRVLGLRALELLPEQCLYFIFCELVDLACSSRLRLVICHAQGGLSGPILYFGNLIVEYDVIQQRIVVIIFASLVLQANVEIGLIFALNQGTALDLVVMLLQAADVSRVKVVGN